MVEVDEAIVSSVAFEERFNVGFFLVTLVGSGDFSELSHAGVVEADEESSIAREDRFNEGLFPATFLVTFSTNSFKIGLSGDKVPDDSSLELSSELLESLTELLKVRWRGLLGVGVDGCDLSFAVNNAEGEQEESLLSEISTNTS